MKIKVWFMNGIKEKYQADWGCDFFFLDMGVK